MTLTDTAVSTDARRAALVELADLIDTEDRHPTDAPFTPVLPLFVQALCPHLHADVADNMFSDLVSAVAESRRFDSDEDAWLERHDLPRTDRTRWAIGDQLRADVEFCADRLVKP